jgi:hypothetical protein
MELCFRNSEGLLDVARLREAWRHLRELPRHDPDVMTHGDLTPGNVLVADGRLTGILDAGGLGPADPALDLVAAWHLLDTQPRRTLWQALGSDDLQWERGKAWAFEQAIGATWYYLDSNPGHEPNGSTHPWPHPHRPLTWAQRTCIETTLGTMTHANADAYRLRLLTTLTAPSPNT